MNEPLEHDNMSTDSITHYISCSLAKQFNKERKNRSKVLILILNQNSLWEPRIELWTNAKAYDKQVYTLPKHLDEKVAMLHLEKLGVELTKLRPDQASYINVPETGPFKPDHYRY